MADYAYAAITTFYAKALERAVELRHNELKRQNIRKWRASVREQGITEHCLL